MLGGTALATPGADSLNVSLICLNLSTVGAGRQLHESMQGDRNPGAVLLRLLHEVGIDASDDGLMRDDENIFAAFQFHDDGFETDDHIAVALAAAVAVVVLVLIASLEILRILVGDLLVRHTIADSSIELIERLPLQLVVVLRQVASCSDGSLQGRSPHRQRPVTLPGELAEGPSGKEGERGRNLGAQARDRQRGSGSG